MKKGKSTILEALRNAAVDEVKAVAFLEAQRWGDAACCPRCGDMNVYQMMTNGERNKDYRWRCRGCKAMFTVRTKTALEETRLPLRIWVYAIWKAASSKKGISALQLSREMEITHKSALFVLRRLRHGLEENDPPKLNIGTYADYKTPVAGIVQRGGDVRFRVMPRVTASTLSEFVAENADRSCRLITDEAKTYKAVGRAFEGGHKYVRHSMKQYVRRGTDIHSNTIEGVFSLLQRGVMGTFHSVSRKHLPNYLNEFQFRWNTRRLDDGQRVSRVVKALDGKRLEYRQSVENPPYLIGGQDVSTKYLVPSFFGFAPERY
jgi:transposase-like protein